MAEPAEEGFTEDGLLSGRVRLTQPAHGYRVAIDAVILAAAVPVQPEDIVLDVGTGVGGAALCLLAREPRARLAGLELQPAFADLAQRNAAANGVASRFEVFQGDIISPPAMLLPASFDHVMVNPPFRVAEEGNASPDPAKATATFEGSGSLAVWISFALDMARPGGTVSLIHEAARLAGVLEGLNNRAGGIVVCPLWPSAGRPARRIVVVARKGGRAPLTLHPGLFLHGADGGFTPEAQAILRDAAGLDLGQSASRRRRPRGGAD